MFKKFMSLLLAAALSVTALTACGQSGGQGGAAETSGSESAESTETGTESGTKSSTEGSTESITESSTEGGAETAASTESGGEVVEFTWFRPQANRNAIVYWNDALWIQELEKRLNVKITFEGPLVGPTTPEYAEAVNIMLNSGDFPDVLYFDWLRYSGGLAAAIEDGIVVNISNNPDYWAHMPNWQALLDSNDFIRRSNTLDDGSSAMFNHVEENTNRNVYEGYAIREDWLAQVNMEAPKTVDDLYAAFTAIKGQMPDVYPLTDELGLTTIQTLAPAWGMKRNVPYPDPETGKITYWTLYKNGEAFTDFVTTLNKWYSEGLIDPDFASNDWAGREAKMTTQKSGFSFILPQQYQSWRDAIIAANPDLDGTVHFLGLEPLTGPAGKQYNTNGMNNWGGGTAGNVVTTAAEKDGKVEKILDVIDYLYSPEGTILNGWGVEGVSYNINADGEKEWAEAVTNDPTFSFGDAVFKYAIPTQGDWPKLMSYEAWLSQETVDPDSARAHENYLKGDPSLSIPDMLLTADEAAEYNRIKADSDTLINEYFTGMILGVRPLTDLDAMFGELENIGLPRAMEIYQAAYDRYSTK